MGENEGNAWGVADSKRYMIYQQAEVKPAPSAVAPAIQVAMVHPNSLPFIRAAWRQHA